MNVLCEHPVFITNVNISRLLLVARGYHTPMHGDVIISRQTVNRWCADFPYNLFTYWRKSLVTIDNMDDWYIFDYRTGETYPMFYIVGCGKCSVCLQKKRSSWRTRVAAEVSTSISVPLFLTLTYNDLHAPFGVFVKEHLQKFMKLLRKYLQNDGYDVRNELRYLAVPEFCKDKRRPHWHMMLFNFPDMTLKKALSYCESAWCDVWYSKEFKGYIYSSRGFCYLKTCDANAITYLTKYMTKTIDTPEDCDFRKFRIYSSRRNGGIGFKFAKDNCAFFRLNPDIIDMRILDKFSGRTQIYNMPSYYTDKFFPRSSVIVEKEVRDNFLTFNDLVNYRYQLLQLKYRNFPDRKFYYMSKAERKVKEKYSFMSWIYNTRVPSWLENLLEHSLSNEPECIFDSMLDTVVQELEYLQGYLLAVDFKGINVDAWQELRSVHKGAKLQKAINSPDVDVKDYAEHLRREHARELNNVII